MYRFMVNTCFFSRRGVPLSFSDIAELKKYAAWIVVFLFAGVIFTQEIAGPRCGDAVEYSFIVPSDKAANEYRPIENVADLIESQSIFYSHENGRVVVHSFVQALASLNNPWLFAALDAIMYLLLVRFVVQLLRMPACRRTLIVVATGTYLYISSVSTDVAFQINYLWVSTFIVGFLTVFRRNHRPCRIWMWPLFALLGLMAGESNEAFTVGIMVAMPVWLALKRKRCSAIRILLAVSFCAGFMINVLAPGNFVRLAIFMPAPVWDRIFNLIWNTWYLWVAVMILLIRWRRGYDVRLFLRRNIFLLMALLAQGIMLWLLGTVYLYACMGLRLFIMLILLDLLRGMRIRRGWIWTVTAVCLFSGVCNVVQAARKAETYNYIYEAYMQSEDGEVTLPSSLFGYDYRSIRDMSAPYTWIRRSSDRNAPELRVMPEGLKELPADKDTNMVWQTDANTFVIVQSKTAPVEYYLVKRLNYGENRIVDVRKIDTAPLSHLDYWTESEVWRAGVYHNRFPAIFHVTISDKFN